EFDPAKNLGTTANGGNGRNQQCQIITCEANGTGSRVFQFRLDPIGTASPLNLGQPMLEFIRGPGTQSIWVPIPTNGPNAIVSNNWYHVAVTYNGVPNTVSNLNLYWTLMDPSRTSANLIGSANLTANLSPVASATTDFTIGNSGRNPSGSTANPLLANFLGLIDEVRLSKVARTANQMQFVNPLTITAQPQNATAAPGETVVFSLRATTDFAPLSYQWRSNGVNLVDGGDISGAATATLQLANVQFAYAADYDCVVGNSRTPVPDSVTSAAASLTVRTPLDLAWRGTINSTWDTSTANWWETSSGIEAPFTTGDRVTFDDAGSAASLVNLSETIMPKSLTINATASYTLTGNGKLSGASGLTKLNAGTLTVTTTNDYTGPTYLGGGTLSVASLANGSLPSAIGAASSAAGNLVFDGGALAYTGPSTAIDRGATLNSGGGMINVAASSSTLALGGAIAGASGGGLTKAGDGTLLLTSANPYNGPTTIAAGTLQLGSSGTLGSGPVLNSGTLAFYFPGAVNFGNPIAGPGSVFNSGPGNLTLGGTNSYSGLTIATAGTLTLANGRALGNSPLLFVSSTTGGALGGTRVALNAGVTIDETVGLSLPSNASGDVRSILFANGPSSWNGPISLNGNGTIAFSGTTGGLTIGGNISSPTFMGLLQLRVGSGYSGVIAGTVTLASEDSTVQINDGGTWTISSAGNSWGLSQIANGTLRLGQDYALPIDTTVELGKAGSGTLDLAGFNQQIAGLIVAGTASSQVIGNSSTLYDSTLTFSSSGSSVYGGRMVDALGGGSRRVALEIAGGTLAFTAPQTYSGQTLVRAGTLALNGVGTIDRSASLVVAAGATLDASGRADGKLTLAAGQILQGDGTVRGNLVVGSGSTLSPGMGVGVLTNLGPVSLASGGNAVIEVSDATGGPGVGYDSLYVLRGVDVQATNSTPFRIQLVSVGDRGAAHFDNNTSYAWTIATATEGVTGYAPDALVLDTASFSNDLAGGSFILSPNTLVVNFTNNHPPVANVVTYVRPKDATLQISIADLATNWSDPDGDAVALVSVAPDSTNGVGNVSSDGTNIFYTAGAGGNVPDAISYTIRDVRSSYRPGDTVRTTVGTILVAMVPDDTTPTLSSQTAPAMLVSSLSSAQATQTVTSAGTAGATYLQCLTNFERYAESIWHTASYAGAPADAGYWGDGGSSGNGGIRGNSGVAVAYAVLVMALPDAPQVTNRLARLRQALNYNAATHVTGATRCVNGSSWGWSSASSTDWQTPEWSASMGLACVLVQSQLPAATVQAVQRVIASEATHRAGIAPASGYVSDTKAEENAWDGNVLALGAAWLSANPSAAQWLQAA
ncbi:MAG TPA: autotransporter-associated beta strand repeat-containing protein, partial [Candidatus Sulfotelmatobacter sp.]|nr:autotransporter-associated beta strand repeat-containing protein [Candidatus Sulfotelmatobacter sp.]